MKITELYTKECRVWIPDNENVWRGASLVNDYKLNDKEIKVLLEPWEDEEGVETTKVLVLSKPEDLPHLRNPEILIGENDLTSLSYLHEPAVLYNLQVRFVERNAIYTYCGIVLVAINPYDKLSIYSNEFIELYSGRNLGEMDPHIFAIAEEAFKQMSREERNQSIIVTGESGAGKTVSAKYTMRYFASVGGSSDESNVEQKVLASNPIMESIGNAKTTRNDNSSRFGKYIQIGFSKRYHIIGSNIRTYLLEKSRVVSQGPDERNYHIFYQLCACCDLPQFQPLKLMPASNFEYTRVGNCIEIDGVDDKKEFQETVHALTLLGVSSKHQSLIFRLLSAILHMGNIDIEEGSRGNDSCRIDLEDKHLQAMCELLGIEAKQMAQWFCNKKLVAMAEVVVTPLKYDEALFARDALAKHMYAKLFEWIVKKVNNALITNEKQHSFIGVLDIYGFETFDINSFEQFCINYANEKLQQQFCQHVFKLEQEEYVREEIEWKFIDFYDNQPCIDLIESKMGILDLLNDECRMPKGSDVSWAQKLYNRHLKTSKHFDKSKLSNTSFFVVHFADKVKYECEGFLEKNRDTVREEQLNILKASQFELIGELFMDNSAQESVEVKVGMRKGGAARITSSRPAAGGFGNKKKEAKKTVASQFQESLGQLMTILNSTTPHYVRCVKPNDYKLSFTFDEKRAVQQLRACGVLETIRISAAGYPSRWSYPEFHGRYRVLMQSKEINKKSHRKTCEAVLSRLIPEPDKYQPGKSKIFFRAGQVAYLEKLRADKLRACAVLIQKQVRMWLKQKAYLRMKNAALVIQRFARGHQARRLVTSMRRTRASIKIQTCWRRYVETKKYTKVRRSVIVIQAYTRGMFARKLYMGMVYEAKAIVIQKYMRGYLARKHFNRQLKAIVYLQCCVRRMRARKELKALKVEARSVGHLKKLNKGMENKIMELQRKLDMSNFEKITFEKKAKEVEVLREKISASEQTQDLVTQLKSRIAELESEVSEVRAVLSDTQAESKIALESMKRGKTDKDEVILNLTSERNELDEKTQSMQAELVTKLQELKEENEKVIESKCAQVETELTKERQQHQTVLKDYNRLEQRYDNIKDELELLRSKGENSEENPQESAYFSYRSNQSNINQQSLVNGDSSDSNEAKGEEFSEFQEKINDLEKEKSKLQERICAQKQTTVEFVGQLKMKETAVYNEQLKNEINNLRKAIAEDAGKYGKDGRVFEELFEQTQVMQEELEVRRDEVIQLKSYMAGQSMSTIDQATMTSPDLLGSKNRMEDITLDKLDKSDLKAVLVTMYDHNRMLELEIESERKNHEVEMIQLESTIKQNKMKKNGSFNLASNMTNSNDGEVTELKSEILKLQASVESLEKSNHRLKRQLKLYSKKLNSEVQSNVLGVSDSYSSLSRNSSSVSRASHHDDDSASIQGHPILRHKDSATGGAMGMYQYNSGDEGKIVQSLILDFKPRGVAVSLIPELPAFILFKLLRYADHSNDDKMIKRLLQHIISAIKKVQKRYVNDSEYLSFWLSNTCRFFHNMKQFSGEEEFIKDSTAIQKEQCFRNFDLGEYRPMFSDMAVSFFQRLVLNVVKKIKPMIVPAMLEHDSIQGLGSSSKPSGMRGRSSSRGEDDSAETVETLMKQLTAYHQMMIQHGIEAFVIKQVFRQVVYAITATTLNNQLVRNEMCNWSKAMQIRYNVSQLEEWLRKSDLGDDMLKDMLQPLVHTSQLLQVKKQTDTDADEIISMCTSLNDQQIVKLLQMITPTNDYEERVSMKFIKIVQKKLKGQGHTPAVQGDSFLMDTNRNFTVTFPYTPTQQPLEMVVIPDGLKASSLIKAI